MAWKQIEPLPVARQRHSAGSWRNFIYVAGGASDASAATAVTSVLKSRINAVDDGNQPWSQCAPDVTDPKIGTQMLILGGTSAPGNGVMMLVGGRGASVDDTGILPAQDIWAGKLNSNGDIDTWKKQVGVLPSPMTDMGLFVHNSWLYLLGGMDLKVQQNYKTQTVNFAVGEVVRGETSGAAGTILTDNDAGVTGTLIMDAVTGLFQNNEILYVREAKAVGAQVTRLDYNTGTGAFTVGQVVTGTTSLATGTISAISGTVATGTLTLTGVVGTFQAAENITDPITGAAKAVAAQYTALDYNSQVQNFVVGQTVKGLTSGATATIVSDADAGTTGTLTINTVVGTFQAAEWLIVEKATANGAQTLYQTVLTDIYRARLEEDGTVGAFTLLTAKLPTALAPGQTVVLRRDKVIITDTVSMYVAKIMPGGDFSPWVTTALPFSAVSHLMLKSGDDDIISISGYDGAAVNAQVWSTSVDADGSPKAWAQQMPLLTEVENAAAAVIADRVFVIGGLDSGSAVKTLVQVARINSRGQI